MSVKIFLPTELFYTKENCDIYGEIQINENNAISYFVIAANQTKASGGYGESKLCYHQLRNLGHIIHAGTVAQQQRDVALTFAYDDETPNIYLLNISIKPPNTMHANVFLYDRIKVLQLHGLSESSTVNSYSSNVNSFADDAASSMTEKYDDMHLLYNLLIERERAANSTLKKKTIVQQLFMILDFPFELMTYLFILLMECHPVELFLRQSVLYEHYLEWKKFRATNKRNANITVDKILGICVMLMLLFIIPHPGDFLIQASHLIIKNLRLLLRALKGSPIGLKLNVHLNNFFLDCFNYHIDLWATFLDIIEPLIRVLFVPIAILGSMGFSYQLASLADLIAVMGLHAHCFYIYTAVLYKVEINGLLVLWKVVLGKRYNVLKSRVESHNYMNRQLYLATIFFSALLFLFPTILVYYVVFTSLRLCIHTVNSILQLLRRHILEFPLENLFEWLMGNFYLKEGVQLEHIQHVPSPFLQPETKVLHMFLYKLNVQSSSLARVFSCESGVLQELTATDKQTSCKTIFNRIIEGKF